MDDQEFEERTESITDRIWMAEAYIEELQRDIDRLKAENADLHSRLEELENTDLGIDAIRNQLRKLQWCVENGVRG